MKKKTLIIVTLFLIPFIFLFQNSNKAEAIEISEIKHDNVILYTTAWCGYCKRTRTFLDVNHIKYIEYDIEKSEEANKQHQALGGRGVPTIDIKGTVIHGYSVKKMKSVFKALHLM